MTLMKAAIAHQMRPSVLVLGKGSNKGWGEWDTLLAKAYQRYLDELCPQCHGPKYLCHNDDNRIQYKLATDECSSKKVSEKAQAELAKKGDKAPASYGKQLYAEPYLTADAIEEGLEFSDFRKPYLIDRAKRLGLIPDDEPVSGNHP